MANSSASHGYWTPDSNPSRPQSTPFVTHRNSLIIGLLINALIGALGLTLFSMVYPAKTAIGSVEYSGQETETYVAQTFVPQSEAHLQLIRFYLQKNPEGGSVHISLVDSATRQLLFEQELPLDMLADGKNELSVMRPTLLRANVPYLLQLKQLTPTKHGVLWNWNFYPNGILLINNTPNPSRDLAFEIEVGSFKPRFNLHTDKHVTGIQQGIVRLDGSEPNTRYQLLRNGQRWEQEKKGTGGQLFWTDLPDGHYTAVSDFGTDQMLAMIGHIDLVQLPALDQNRFRFQKEIVIDGSQIFGQLENYPLLIELRDPELTEYIAQSKYDHLAITNLDYQVLSHEVEQIDYQNGVISLWLRMPYLSEDTDIRLLLHFGAETAAASQAPDCWSGYLGRWGFGPRTVAKANGRQAAYVAPGISATALMLTGAETLPFAFPGQEIPATQLEVSFWIRSQAAQTALSSPLRLAQADDAQTPLLSFDFDAFTSSKLFARLHPGHKQGSPQTETTPLLDNHWHYVAMQWDGSQLATWVDGQLIDHHAFRTSALDLHRLVLSFGNGNMQQQGFEGLIDEVRIGTQLHSPDWHASHHHNLMQRHRLLKSVSELRINPYYNALAQKVR